MDATQSPKWAAKVAAHAAVAAASTEAARKAAIADLEKKEAELAADLYGSGSARLAAGPPAP